MVTNHWITPKLAYKCPVPACRNEVVDPREPCARCQHTFLDYLQRGRSETPVEEFLAAQHDSQRNLHRALAEQSTIERTAS